MPAWTLSQLQASVGNDLALIDGVQSVTFNQMTAAGALDQAYSGVNGWGDEERFPNVFGMEVIIRPWYLQANQFAVSRINLTDQIVDAAGAVWIIYTARKVIWDTQWACEAIRQDCLLSIAGTVATLEAYGATADGSGGQIPGWTAVASNVQTRWEIADSHVEEPFDQKHLADKYRVFCLQSCSIGQRWNLGNDADDEPIVYRIEGVSPRLNRSPFAPLFQETLAVRERGMVAST